MAGLDDLEPEGHLTATGGSHALNGWLTNANASQEGGCGAVQRRCNRRRCKSNTMGSSQPCRKQAWMRNGVAPARVIQTWLTAGLVKMEKSCHDSRLFHLELFWELGFRLASNNERLQQAEQGCLQQICF